MQSVVFEQFGEPNEVLTLQDQPALEPARGEVSVRMLASPVNPSDLMSIRGIYSLRPELPATPGFEGVGIVTASGGGLLGRLLVGKRAAILNQGGGNWREHTVVSARQVIPIPAQLSVEQAAMFFINPATAYIMSCESLRVPRGEWLVQTAAASALGKMVIRLGQSIGFRTVSIVRRQDQAEELKALGTDEAVVFDPAHQENDELRRSLHKIVGPTGVRYAIDAVAGATGSALVGSLGEQGRMLVYGTLSNEPLSFSSRSLMKHGAQVQGFWLGQTMSHLSLVRKLKLIRRVSGLIQTGVLASECGETFPLTKVRAAVTAAEATGKNGKVVLKISDPE